MADVEQRVADGAGVPVDDRREPGRWIGRDHHVERAVVAVQDRGGTRFGSVRFEPVAQEVELGKVAGAVAVELGGPARDLTFEEAVGLAESLEPARDPVDRGQRHDAVDVGHGEVVAK